MAHTILYVEDDPMAQEIMRDVITRNGHGIIVANNGADGVRLAQKEQPDLIFMDIMMPTMDGLEATRRLKANAQTADIPVIALTAVTDNRMECLEAGMSVYLNKPVRVNDVIDVLEHILPPLEGEDDAPEGKKRLLVAEDDNNLRRMFSRTFRKRDFNVAVALDGEEAIEKVEAFRPDIVILDVNMPKVTGLDVLQHIRQQPGGDALQVIVVSGNDTILHSPQAALADLVLLKPVSVRELVTLAQRLVN